MQKQQDSTWQNTVIQLKRCIVHFSNLNDVAGFMGIDRHTLAKVLNGNKPSLMTQARIEVWLMDYEHYWPKLETK